MQQPLEGALIGVVVLPRPEIPNMAVVAQLECPGFFGGEHGVIETHRKQHRVCRATPAPRRTPW